MSLPSVPQLKLRRKITSQKASLQLLLTNLSLLKVLKVFHYSKNGFKMSCVMAIGELGTGYSLLDPVHNLCGLIHAHN